MLRLIGFTDENTKVELTGIISLAVNQEEKVPADDLSVTLPYSSDLPELYLIELYEDDTVVFKGVVDEQQTVVSGNDAYNRITARSMAALLLDNESEPVSYRQPSASVIFSRHIKPLGFESYKGGNKVCKEVLNISKGFTNWKALEMFCKKAYGGYPRVESDGTVNFNGVENDIIMVFSDKDGINYNSLSENKRRCKIISAVNVKLKSDSGYTYSVKNGTKAAQKLQRVRYVDASIPPVSPDIAQTIIDNGNASAYELKITVNKRLLNILGAKASLKDSLIGDRDNLRVSSVYYTLTPKKEQTTVILRKEN